MLTVEKKKTWIVFPQKKQLIIGMTVMLTCWMSMTEHRHVILVMFSRQCGKGRQGKLSVLEGVEEGFSEMESHPDTAADTRNNNHTNWNSFICCVTWSHLCSFPLRLMFNLIKTTFIFYDVRGGWSVEVAQLCNKMLHETLLNSPSKHETHRSLPYLSIYHIKQTNFLKHNIILYNIHELCFYGKFKEK